MLGDSDITLRERLDIRKVNKFSFLLINRGMYEAFLLSLSLAL